jgi:hypothetical protein
VAHLPTAGVVVVVRFLPHFSVTNEPNANNNTMKIAIVASLFASATAFAPASVQKQSIALSASPYEKELGVQAPLGFFDPMGMLNDVPKEGFDNLREIEIKHGRVAVCELLDL